ncbi:hypothetical protein AALC17_12310 [Oscillospiraceae bacterium 38-13]
MEPSWEKLENYQKNLRCLQEAEDELLEHMKGHDWSFRQAITDKKEKPSQEKLQALVTEMLETWAARVRERTDANPDTGESLAEPWLRERQELCGLYLYLVMRCSLEKGGYRAARKGQELKERTDFAFLLEQARRLSRDWCVLSEPDGSRHSEPYWGFDTHFGFHLYYALQDPGVLQGCVCTGNDYSLTPDWSRACDRLNSPLTNEGNFKRIHIRHSGFHFRKAKKSLTEEEPQAEENPQTEEEPLVEEPEEPETPDEEEDYDLSAYDDCNWVEEDEDWYFPFPSAEAYQEFHMNELEQLSEEGSRAMELTFLAAGFENSGEYCSACQRFAKLFRAASPEVLRDFCQNLEEIVDLYLAVKGIAPLADTDKAMDVYSRIFDGALRQAKRYGRGIQWNDL